MDLNKENGKSRKGNNLIIKTWERCKSIGRGTKKSPAILTEKSKSWPRLHRLRQRDGGGGQEIEQPGKRHVAPEGCFAVYVGPEKQRFVIRTKHANHPLFKILLDEAESEYGYNPEGPLALPCNVEIFSSVLVAMNNSDGIFHRKIFCGFSGDFAFSLSHHRLLSSSSLVYSC